MNVPPLRRQDRLCCRRGNGVNNPSPDSEFEIGTSYREVRDRTHPETTTSIDTRPKSAGVAANQYALRRSQTR
jgi:hypothetical protein